MINKIKLERNYYNEWARVGTFNEKGNIIKKGDYDLRIYSEPLGNPSFHVIYKNDWEVILQIKDFEILEWKKEGKLTKRFYRILIKFFSQQNNVFKINNWELLLKLWNTNNPDYEVSLNLSIPNMEV